jgi:hypothetical protein
MTLNFLIQATRVLSVGNYDEEELKMVCNFLVAVDEEIMQDYNCTCTILSYDNDLQLFIEILESVILIFEEREEYEMCERLKNKKIEAIKIIKNKTI